MDSTQTAAQVIDALASKLAVPTSHLWGVLVRQAPINAAIQVGYLALMAIVSWQSYRFVRAHWRKETDDRGYGTDDGDFRRMFFSVALVVLGVFLIVQSAGAIEALGYLANPEYFALHQILSSVGR